MSAARWPAGQPGNTSVNQGLLVELGQFQRLQPGRQGLASQSSRRLQTRLAALLQVPSQRRPDNGWRICVSCVLKLARGLPHGLG